VEPVARRDGAQHGQEVLEGRQLGLLLLAGGQADLAAARRLALELSVVEDLADNPQVEGN
jgi:hypothetical protein